MNDDLPSTETWLLEAIMRQDGDQLNAAFERFLARYGPGLAAILSRRFGTHAETAGRLVQDFVHFKVFENELVAGFLRDVANQPEPSARNSPRGFRKLLVTSLFNYARTRWKQEQARQRREQQVAVPEDVSEDLEDFLAVEKLRDLALHVLRRTRDHYQGIGQQQHWDLFARLRIEPAICPSRPPTYDQLAREFDLDPRK